MKTGGENMIKREVIRIGGAIPFRNFKERVREVATLRKQHNKVKIHIENGFIFYEYKEIS